MKGYSTFPKSRSLAFRGFSVISWTLVVGSYSSAEMQSVYSTAPANWANILYRTKYRCIQKKKKKKKKTLHTMKYLIFLHKNFQNSTTKNTLKSFFFKLIQDFAYFGSKIMSTFVLLNLGLYILITFEPLGIITSILHQISNWFEFRPFPSPRPNAIPRFIQTVFNSIYRLFPSPRPYFHDHPLSHLIFMEDIA